jgi:hypothetical protein
MRLEGELEDEAERGEQGQEEDDRERLSHSFSPLLSTAERPEAPISSVISYVFTFCSFVKRRNESQTRRPA